MKIRKAKIEDANQIALLCQNTIKYVNSKDYTKKQIKAWLTKNTTVHVRNKLGYKNRPHFIMLDKEKIVGVVAAKLDKKEITGLYVYKKYLGKGIGKMLLHKMEQHMQSQGLNRIQLHSTLTAFNFYKSKGYKKIKQEEQKMDGVLIPSILMKKNLLEK